jgi:hypothetical protein
MPKSATALEKRERCGRYHHMTKVQTLPSALPHTITLPFIFLPGYGHAIVPKRPEQANGYKYMSQKVIGSIGILHSYYIVGIMEIKS